MWDLLATAAPDPQVSGTWVLALIGKVFGGLTLLAGAVFGAHKHGQKKERQRLSGEVTLKPPVPTVPTQKVFSPPSWDQHTALEARMTRAEGEIKAVREIQSQQYVDILKHGQERETRLAEKIDASARVVHARLDELLKFLHVKK